MNAVVFEHVPVAELPEKWRAKLTQADSATVTLRIEEEPQATQAQPNEFADDPLTIRCSGCGATARTWSTWPAMCASSAPRGSTRTIHAAATLDA